jgi:integrase
MVGKRAKVLSPDHVEDLLVFAAQTRHPLRNQVLVLLSVKAGLRASEIANLTWPMVIDPTGQVSTCLELQSRIAKKGSGRSATMPLFAIERRSSKAIDRRPQRPSDR